MSEHKISNRYATALFQQALENKMLEETAQDMKLIANTCKNNKDLMNVLSNPIINPNEKLKALKQIFSSIGTISSRFIELICLKKREDLLDKIAESFIDLYSKHLGIQRVDLTSAIELDNATKEEIKAYVKQQTSAKEVELNSQINPDIIGGFVIKFGDRLLDTSISAKLRKLKKELNIA